MRQGISVLASHQRKFGLDIIRAIAILSVFLCHTVVFFYPFTKGTGEIVFNYLSWAGGYYGVEIFFILSGFLIGTIFITQVVQPCQVSGQSSLKRYVADFWFRRWIRTLPSYYLFIIINLLILPFSGAPMDTVTLVKFLVFVQGMADANTDFFGVSWSLAVEEWFYLLLPILFFCFFVYNGRSSAKFSFFLSLLLLWIIPMVMKLCLVFTTKDPSTVEALVHYRTPYKLDSISYGLLLSLAYTHDAVWEKLTRQKVILFIVGLLALVTSLLFSFLFVVKPNPNPYSVLVFGPLCSIAIMACFPLLVDFAAVKNENFITRSITNTSLISYSLYLCHVPILLLSKSIAFTLNAPSTIWFALLLFIINLIASYLVAYLLYTHFEKPILNWRGRVSKKIFVS